MALDKKSEQTKRLLTDSLKRQMEQKPLNKISIREICDGCGVNRQTFYYHFRDKYELLKWIYTDDAQQVFDENLSFENWPKYISALLNHMRSEKDFYINTIRSDETCFEQFLFDLTKSIFHMAIVSLDQHHQINEVEMNFYSQFYSFGITGVIISWVKSDMRESAERVSANLKSLAQDSEKLAYSRYREAYTKITNEEEEHEE